MKRACILHPFTTFTTRAETTPAVMRQIWLRFENLIHLGTGILLLIRPNDALTLPRSSPGCV